MKQTIASALISAAVWAAASAAFAAAGSPALVIITQGEQAPISTRIGAPVSVALDYAGGTGYAWLVPDPLPPGVRLVSNGTAPATPGLPGGPVRQTITFAIDTPGQVRMTLAFRRSWLPASDADPKVILRFSVTQ